MLGLQAEAVALLIDLAALAGDAAVEKVSGVELHAGLGGVGLEDAPRGRLVHSRRQLQLAVAAVNDEIVIVAAAAGELVVVLVDARAYGGRLREVERRSFDATQFAGR